MAPTRLPLIQVDAFASAPFTGNPAAVCLLDGPRDTTWMQNVGREMNLSETAFLYPEPDADAWRLRWFTPSIEVDLCGHATLASAHVLWLTERLPLHGNARFLTRSGLLTAHRDGDWIQMDFPATIAHPAQPPAELLQALGTEATFVGSNKFDYLVEVSSEEILRSLTPDHSRLRKLPVRGIIVTARGKDYDFVSRFFAPGSGIDEDPVTGSAHTALTPYWSAKLARTEMVAFQASQRGGVVRVRFAGDRVLLAGQAVTVLQGELLV